MVPLILVMGAQNCNFFLFLLCLFWFGDTRIRAAKIIILKEIQFFFAQHETQKKRKKKMEMENINDDRNYSKNDSENQLKNVY